MYMHGAWGTYIHVDGDHPTRFALWHYAKHAMFYPSIFDERSITSTPCGNCSVPLQHFIAYLHGTTPAACTANSPTYQ